MNVYSEAKWRARTSDSWLEVTPAQGTAGNTTVTVETTSTATATRNGRVYFELYDEDYSTTTPNNMEIPVYQEGLPYDSFNVSPTSLSFTCESGQEVLIISSNIGWEAESNRSWITISATEGSGDCSLTVNVEQNTSADYRVGRVTITPDGMEPVRISVYQEGMQ